VTTLAAGNNIKELAEQVAEFKPELVVIGEETRIPSFKSLVEHRLPHPTEHPELLAGPAGLETAARSAPVVVNGLVGALGLRPSLATVETGARLALANKESLVLGGELLMTRARATGAEILPVDSEHSGVFQVLGSGGVGALESLTLTASGGPLLRHPDWKRARPDEVLNHPVWEMGKRITTDSATLLNKGLEVIEAHWLFDLEYDRIRVLIHPEAAVHAMVEWRDGSLVAQLSTPDMRLPIQLALTWPERLDSPIVTLDLAKIATLNFQAVERGRFPCLDLALDAGRQGGLAPTILNAADEVAVDLFHDGQIQLGDVPDILKRVLAAHPSGSANSLEAIEEADAWARSETRRAAVKV
jgi:1-deoxy-D-xylulose-5-phosphate reductoisomerase